MSETDLKNAIVKPCGDDVVRVTGLERARLLALGHYCRQSFDFDSVVDGVSSLTVQFDPLTYSAEDVVQILADAASRSFENVVSDGEGLVLTVRFGGEDGPDLEHVLSRLNLTEDALLQRLCEQELTVDMLGFTPGFAYIRGLDAALSVARRETPRQSVPAGSLGLAAGMVGTYALDGPGGWQIIGRVINTLFDPKKDDPFLLVPGQKVRIQQAGDSQ